MSISSSLVWIGAALAMALLGGCDERTKQANDPSKPPMPKVVSQPLVPQLPTHAAPGQSPVGGDVTIKR